MELRHLRYMLALAEHRSFTLASRAVHVTQSTLSHQIRQLELELGVELFDRTGREVVPTAAGETMLPGVRQALAELNGAIRDLKQRKDDAAAEVRFLVGARGVARRILAGVLAGEDAPHGKISPRIEEVYAATLRGHIEGHEGRYDIVVGDIQNLPADWWFEPLYYEDVGLLVPAGHRFASRRRLRIVDLHGEPLVLASPPEPTRLILDRCLHSAGAVPRIVAELNMVEATFEVAASGGFCVVATRNFNPCHEMIYVPLEDPVPERLIGLMWQPGNGDSPTIRAITGQVHKAVETFGAGKDPTFRIRPARYPATMGAMASTAEGHRPGPYPALSPGRESAVPLVRH